MDDLETRARREDLAVVGRRPRTTGAGHHSERERSSRWPAPADCALEKRSPRHSSSPLIVWMVSSVPNRREARRNRRAPGSSAGGEHGCDERSRSEKTCFSPVGGDRQVVDCSAVNYGYDLSISARSSLPIRVYLRDLRANRDGWRCDVFVSLCLRVCDVRGWMAL